jgi:hypothetical protein
MTHPLRAEKRTKTPGPGGTDRRLVGLLPALLHGGARYGKMAGDGPDHAHEQGPFTGAMAGSAQWRRLEKRDSTSRFS